VTAVKAFQYGDEQIGAKEILFLLPSYIHGVLILTVPRLINKLTDFGNGWLCLVIGGLIATVFALITAKLAVRFRGETFLDYAGQIVSRPLAYIFTVMMLLHFMLITIYEVAAVGAITQMYLLPKTPYEVSSLVFLLVLIYGVSGSRAGLLRLNLLFFPIYTFILIVTHLSSLSDFDVSNLKPWYVADTTTMIQTTSETLLMVVGFEILLLYTTYTRKQVNVPKYSIFGMLITVSIIVFSYLMVIGIMGRKMPAELMFPTIDMVRVGASPAGFLERTDVLFFVIWTMSIFNTGAMALDALMIVLNSLFPKVRKMQGLLIMAPLIYVLSMQPPSVLDILGMLKIDIYLQIPLSFIIPPLLLLVAAVRKLPKRGEPA
jgi:spore germination protein